MASRLDIMNKHGAGYVWDHLLTPKTDILCLANCLIAAGMYRQNICVKMQETVNEITFVYYLEKGGT